MIAASTTVTRPSRNAKMQTNSSGRLPSALWTTPVAPDPSRSATCSTLRPTSAASAASARPATMKVATCAACE